MSEDIATIELLISQGRFFEARSTAEALLSSGNDLRLKQLFALATSKSGNPKSALDFLSVPYAENPSDPETAGILGGIYKELFKKYQDTKYAVLSRDTYNKNFQATNNYYTGINAATMSVIAGKATQGREIATSVINTLGEKTDSIWEAATLGEAYLLTRNRERSIQQYIKARQLAGKDWGKVLSIHNQLWLLNHYMPVPKEVLRIFAPPVVLAFAGHMLDAPGRSTPRFPPTIERQVKESIRGAIRTLQASIGYCSMACGGDILFAETMIEEGGEVHILMPFNRNDFLETSIRFAGDAWVERFERLQSLSPTKFIVDDNYGGNDDLFSLLGKVVFGSAILRSHTYHQEPFLVTVLSELDMKRREGGTRDTVQLWPFPQHHTNINPDQFITLGPPGIANHPSPQDRTIIPNRPVLFLAHLNFSGLLPMDQERIEKLIKSLSGEEQLALKIYEELPTGIVIGLESEIGLLDIVRAVWTSTAPLKSEKPLRVTLHVAPVHVKAPQENKNFKFLCAISEFTPQGTLSASAGMAAVLALYPRKFQLDYAGVIQLPAEDSNHDLYQLTFKL